MRDPFRTAVLYLRLWKLSDILLSRTGKHDSARVFDVIPIDAAKLTGELRELREADLSWTGNGEDVAADISNVVGLADKVSLTDKEFVALELLRKKFQDNALKYAGDIQLSRGGFASAT